MNTNDVLKLSERLMFEGKPTRWSYFDPGHPPDSPPSSIVNWGYKMGLLSLRLVSDGSVMLEWGRGIEDMGWRMVFDSGMWGEFAGHWDSLSRRRIKNHLEKLRRDFQAGRR